MSAVKPRVAIVVPTIRETSIAAFLEKWRTEFEGQRLIVVEDNPEPSFTLPRWVEHYAWIDIDRRLDADGWIIPRRSDCVRSFGFLLAAQEECEFIVTLDDDCYPEGGDPGGYLDAIGRAMDATWEDDRWWNTLPGDIFPRGYPYDTRGVRRPTVLHHGLWSSVPDLDARTQLAHPEYRTDPATSVERIPHGRFFPMCGMNLAFRREFTPALYFLLMGRSATGESWPFDRFGDIWAGVFAKRIADHLGFAVSSGAPSILHSRASSPQVNLVKETPGYPVNEILWQRVAAIGLTADSPAGCYAELAAKLEMDGEYWRTLKSAMATWAALFLAGE